MAGGLARLAVSAIGVAAVGAAAARGVRLRDRKEAAAIWAYLLALSSANAAPFTLDMVAGLPEPAQRYFRYAIAPGAELRRVAEIDMIGQIGLGDRATPRYLPMRAREILAPPHGFLWMPSIGYGPLRIAGSDACADGEAWTRFWLLGVVPLVRQGSTPDLVRSAMARSVLEALWVPASLLPCNGVVWEPIGPDRARAVFEHCGERFPLELIVAEDGRPVSVSMPRWSNANPERVYRWQPFGGIIEEVGTFGDYRAPIRLNAGNHFGTDRYFPFFRADVTAIRYC
jgi:hypothetical protein